MKILGLALAGMLALAGIIGCGQSPHSNQLQQIKAQGKLIMGTRFGATSYYLGPDGPTGLEYDLARGFAEHLGVELEVKVAEQFADQFSMLAKDQVDFVAANLAATPERRARFRLGPVYEQVTMDVVYRRGGKRARNPEDLQDMQIAVLADSSFDQALEDLQQEYPDISWGRWENESIEDLLQAVSEGRIDATLVDSNVRLLNRRFFPRVVKAFSLEEPQEFRWLFPAGDDDSLAQAARRYMLKAKRQGRIEALQRKHYEYARNFDQVGLYNFMAQASARLPRLLPSFLQAADEYDLDWRLLAAIGYQESHWDPQAESRTGVRGVMMLTLPTAQQLGVENRDDPAQSIDGGARYLIDMLEKIPERIPFPDRLWMALAAYNIGYGHLEDARRLTQAEGADPDQWKDVRTYLDKLSNPAWYQRTRYGYARGFEAVRYVRNIRSYYDILVWMDNRSDPRLPQSAET